MAWYDEYFGDDYFLLEEPTDLETMAHIAFIRSFIDLPRGSEVLDLACGSGRLSLALARLGYRVTALDYTEDMLERARLEGSRAKVDVGWVQGDMREMPFTAQFDFVLNFLHSFGYFRDDENAAVLGQVAKALKPGGRFLIDLANRESLLRDFEKHARRWAYRDSNFILYRRDIDALTGRLDSNITVLAETKFARTYQTSVRYYSYPELKWLLRQAGLNVLEVYGSYERIPYSLGTPRMIVLAERPAEG